MTKKMIAVLVVVIFLLAVESILSYNIIKGIFNKNELASMEEEVMPLEKSIVEMFEEYELCEVGCNKLSYIMMSIYSCQSKKELALDIGLSKEQANEIFDNCESELLVAENNHNACLDECKTLAGIKP